jgi:hypothetical protein
MLTIHRSASDGHTTSEGFLQVASCSVPPKEQFHGPTLRGSDLVLFALNNWYTVLGTLTQSH